MQRRYDLDWLRVIAFALLMLFHTGMMFSTWDWHIKNLETSGTFDLFMRFLHQWRMPLLFFISGSAVWFAMDRYSTWRYFLERQKRLLLPLVFGMLVVIPPQVYVERLFNHQQFDSFPDFYRTIFTTGSYPQGNLSWHHLWYIPYIWTFSMLTLPLFLFLRSAPGRRWLAWICRQLQRPWFLVLLFVPAAGSDLLVRPFFPEDRMNLISDWANFCHKLTFFMTGFVLASAPAVYDAIARHRRKFLAAGLLSLVPVEAIWLGYWRLPQAAGWAYWLLANVNIWMWLLMVLGYGRHYLSFNHPALRYANEAVYPFYILHQTVIVLLGYQFVYGNWSIPAKFLLVVAGTFSFTWLIYEFLIKRFNVLRVAFGMKPHRAPSPQRAGSGTRDSVSPVPTLSEPQPAQAVPGSSGAPFPAKAFSPVRLTTVLLVMVAAAVIVSACSRGKGRLICRTIDSPSLATNIMGISSRQEVVVFLPPTYDRNTGRYPVLYLLPNFKHNLWRYTGGSFQGFRLKDALNEQMRNSGKQMIVVLPNANHWLGGSWYRNSTLTGNWEDFVVRDLVDYVDSHFRTIPQASSRALAGHGMGGSGALELALAHPGVFGSVFAMSPALFDPNGLRDSGVLSQEMLRHWQSNLQRWNHRALPEAGKREFRDFLQTRLNSPDRSLFMEGLFVSYAAAVSADLSLPYPHILFPATATESDRAVVRRFESGFGGWPEKVANYRAKGQPLAAITIEYGGPGEYDWIRNGSEYLSKQMRSMGIPNTLVVHQGGHESALRQRLESGMLPSVARTLKGENE